jgi:hypothetical protein
MADRLKAWVLGTLAATTALLLALGFGLTWAQLHSEKLPALSVLSALPNSYFIGAGLQTALIPLAMATVTGIVWITFSIKHRAAGNDSYSPWAWALVGFALTVMYRLLGIETSTGKGHDSPSYILTEIFVSVGCMALAVGIGAVYNLVTTWRERSQPTEAGQSLPAEAGATKPVNPWALLGPLLAAVLLLSTLTAGALGIADALQTTGTLPVAQAVLDISCTDVSGGILPYREEDPNAEHRCLVGGRYIGESTTWVYLFTQENTCDPKAPIPAHLIELRRSEISEMIILAKPECPPHARCGSC